MKNSWYLDRCILDKNLPSPVYLQLVRAVIYAVQQNVLKGGDSMPSIRELSEHYNLSKSTLEMGYNDLRDMGIIGSFPRKGFFVSNNLRSSRLRILFLVNELNYGTETIFAAFTEMIGSAASVELCVYNNDVSNLESLIQNKGCDCSHFVIVPGFVRSGRKAGRKLIEGLKEKKLVILNNDSFSEFSLAYDHLKNLGIVMTQAIDRLRKYDSIIIVCPKKGHFERQLVGFFKAFFGRHGFDFEIISDLRPEPVQAGAAYVVIADDQLFLLLDKIAAAGFIAGKDVGVISFGDDDVKAFIMNGLTTISIDFAETGRNAASSILTASDDPVLHPLKLSLRASL